MKKKSDKTILTISEVADMLSVSVGQVRRLVKSAGLPHFQFVKRGQLHFGLDEVTAWRMKHRKVGA